MSRRRKPLGLGLLGLVSPILVLCIWEFASRLGWTNPVLLPSPSQIIAALFALMASGAIASPLAHTAGLFAVGYVLAVLIGMGIGIAMATSRTLYGLLEPLVDADLSVCRECFARGEGSSSQPAKGRHSCASIAA